MYKTRAPRPTTVCYSICDFWCVAEAQSCNNQLPPSSELTCEQQSALGRCEEPFMQGFCSDTCRRCSAPQVREPHPHAQHRRHLQQGGNHRMKSVRALGCTSALDLSAVGLHSSPVLHRNLLVGFLLNAQILAHALCVNLLAAATHPCPHVITSIVYCC